MITATMWFEAQRTESTYQSRDMFYNKTKGFHDRRGHNWGPDAFDDLENFMALNWKKVENFTYDCNMPDDCATCSAGCKQ